MFCLMFPLPSTGLVSQQIPVITAELTVPQPSTGLDWQCDAGNMHVNELPFETCKASGDITRNVAQNIKQNIKLNQYLAVRQFLQQLLQDTAVVV
jgi:ribosomal protein S13